MVYFSIIENTISLFYTLSTILIMIVNNECKMCILTNEIAAPTDPPSRPLSVVSCGSTNDGVNSIGVQRTESSNSLHSAGSLTS